MDPPCHAVVLSIDEKSQIQALDRTQPGLPLKPGKCATMTHDYKRNGTTTLFAALNVLDGTVVGRCMKRHRHQEFITFLNAVERKVKVGKIIHVILDNYGTHKHPKVDQWLANHPRWVFHFTPTSASWLNAVEGFFSAITRRRIRRGVFTSVADLEDAIKRYIADHNRHAKPFLTLSPRTAARGGRSSEKRCRKRALSLAGGAIYVHAAGRPSLRSRNQGHWAAVALGAWPDRRHYGIHTLLWGR
jgi:transposase